MARVPEFAATLLAEQQCLQSHQRLDRIGSCDRALGLEARTGDRHELPRRNLAHLGREGAELHSRASCCGSTRGAVFAATAKQDSRPNSTAIFVGFTSCLQTRLRPAGAPAGRFNDDGYRSKTKTVWVSGFTVNCRSLVTVGTTGVPLPPLDGDGLGTRADCVLVSVKS